MIILSTYYIVGVAKTRDTFRDREKHSRLRIRTYTPSEREGGRLLRIYILLILLFASIHTISSASRYAEQQQQYIHISKRYPS